MHPVPHFLQQTESRAACSPSTSNTLAPWPSKSLLSISFGDSVDSLSKWHAYGDLLSFFWVAVGVTKLRSSKLLSNCCCYRRRYESCCGSKGLAVRPTTGQRNITMSSQGCLSTSTRRFSLPATLSSMFRARHLSTFASLEIFQCTMTSRVAIVACVTHSSLVTPRNCQVDQRIVDKMDLVSNFFLAQSPFLRLANCVPIPSYTVVQWLFYSSEKNFKIWIYFCRLIARRIIATCTHFSLS